MILFDTAMKIAREQGKGALHEWYGNLSDEDKNALKNGLHQKIQSFVEIFGQLATQVGVVAKQIVAFYQQFDPVKFEKLQRNERARRRYERRYNRIKMEREKSK